MSGSVGDYERLADLELEAGKVAVTDEARVGHLNLAATYAHLSELHRRAPELSVAKAEIAAGLKAFLVVTEKLGLTVTAIHINDAIISLNGKGVAPLKT